MIAPSTMIHAERVVRAKPLLLEPLSHRERGRGEGRETYRFREEPRLQNSMQAPTLIRRCAPPSPGGRREKHGVGVLAKDGSAV